MRGEYGKTRNIKHPIVFGARKMAMWQGLQIKLIAVWGETPLQALQAFGKELQPLLECSGLIAMAQDQNPNE